MWQGLSDSKAPTATHSSERCLEKFSVCEVGRLLLTHGTSQGASWGQGCESHFRDKENEAQRN